MKLVKIIFGILLIIFAILQYNDPDPWLWISIYSAAAAIIFFDAAGFKMRKVYFIAIAIFALFSLVYIPGVITYFSEGDPGEIVGSMKAEKPYIEETREILGLLIVIAAFIFFSSDKKTGSKK